MGCLSLTHSFGVNPKIQDCKIQFQVHRDIVLWYSAKRISISWTVQARLTCVTDRRTKRHSLNNCRAQLLYVVRPNTEVATNAHSVTRVVRDRSRNSVPKNRFTSIHHQSRFIHRRSSNNQALSTWYKMLTPGKYSFLRWLAADKCSPGSKTRPRRHSYRK